MTTIDRDKPYRLSSLAVLLVKPTPMDVLQARKIMGEAYLGQLRVDSTTALSMDPPDVLMSLNDVEAVMQETFGHLPSYSCCSVRFDEREAR